MLFSRRRFLHLGSGVVALSAVPRVTRAQAYPSRPVRLIVGSPPGGQLDIIARLTGQWLSGRLGQPFIIDNRPGAGTNIATEAAVRAPADGYVLLLASATAAINATLYDNLKFDFIRDTVPIASISRIPIVLVTRVPFPPKTVAELIAYAKSNPGKLSLATPSKGTGPYMAAQLFRMMTGANIVHVPYRGDAQALSDLIGGQVQAAFGGISAYVENIRSGNVRALAVATPARLDSLPDVPTIGASVSSYEASGWCGIVAPKGTSVEIIDTLYTAINATLADPKFKARLADLGATVLALSSIGFGKFIADETEKWARVVRFAALKPV